MFSDVEGKEWLVSLLLVATTVFNALVQAGGVPFLKTIYLVQLRNGDRIGFWATCRMSGNSCTAVANESPTSPSGALHAVFVVRYLLLGATILYGLVTLVGLYYCFSQRQIEDPGYLRFFRPVAVVALILVGGTSLAVTTLIRVLRNGGSLGGVPVVNTGTNLLEVFLWVVVACIFVTTQLVLGMGAIFRDEGMM